MRVLALLGLGRVSVARATSGLLVATVPCGNPFSSGATACVRAGLWPLTAADRLAGQMRRRASSLGTASVKLRPVVWRSPS